MSSFASKFCQACTISQSHKTVKKFLHTVILQIGVNLTCTQVCCLMIVNTYSLLSRHQVCSLQTASLQFQICATQRASQQSLDSTAVSGQSLCCLWTASLQSLDSPFAVSGQQVVCSLWTASSLYFPVSEQKAVCSLWTVAVCSLWTVSLH